MFSNNNPHIENKLEKVFSLWALIGVTSWAEFASFLGAIYSMLLISEWFWKRFLKDQFLVWGWLKATAKADIHEE
jgi:hypothetical protein